MLAVTVKCDVLVFAICFAREQIFDNLVTLFEQESDHKILDKSRTDAIDQNTCQNTAKFGAFACHLRIAIARYAPPAGPKPRAPLHGLVMAGLWPRNHARSHEFAHSKFQRGDRHVGADVRRRSRT